MLNTPLTCDNVMFVCLCHQDSWKITKLVILCIDNITLYPLNLGLITLSLADVRLPYLFDFQGLQY